MREPGAGSPGGLLPVLDNEARPFVSNSGIDQETIRLIEARLSRADLLMHSGVV